MSSSKGKMKGIVKLIPPVIITKGMIVYYKGQIYKTQFIPVEGSELTVVHDKTGDIQIANKKDLRILAIEHEEYSTYLLKIAQWEKSIANDEINKEVVFVLEKLPTNILLQSNNSEGAATYVAKVLKPKARLYTEEEMEKCFVAAREQQSDGFQETLIFRDFEDYKAQKLT